MLDSVVRIKKKYYPQKLLEECKYKIKKSKTENLIDDQLEPSSSDDEADIASDDDDDDDDDEKESNE